MFVEMLERFLYPDFWAIDLCREVRSTSQCGGENSWDVGMKIARVLARSKVVNLVI